MAATTSATCSSLLNFRSSSVEPRVRTPSSHGSSSSSPGCGKLDGVAMWVINGVAAAFFASLERCSCIRIATHEDEGEEANDVPLIHNDGNIRHEGGTTNSRRRTGKAKKGGSSTFVEI